MATSMPSRPVLGRLARTGFRVSATTLEAVLRLAGESPEGA